MAEEPSDPRVQGASDAGGPARDEGQRLALTLAGRLPCIGCRYDLQGLSVLGNCPECGLAVRATVLYMVDPDADALRPLCSPRIVAAALPLWATCGFLAALCAWLPRLDDMVRHQTGARASLDASWAPWGVLIFAALSGVGSLGLVHLLRGVHKWWTISAAIAAALYIPLLIVLHRIYFVVDPAIDDPYTRGFVDGERLALRLLMGAMLAGILIGFRPNARLLVARCLALRTGRVDRQTILATLAAVGMAACGDAIRLIGKAVPTPQQWIPELGGTLLVVVGSLLLTIGMAGSTLDAWRIRRSIRTPSPSLQQMLGERE